MISIRKLRTLKPGTRERKLVSLLKLFETVEPAAEDADNVPYILHLMKVAEELETLSDEERKRAGTLAALLADRRISVRRGCNALRHLLLRNMHTEPAEWDLAAPGDAGRDTRERIVFPFYLYLDDVRSPFNVGSIFRTAESFGVKRIFLSEDTASPEHPRAQRTAMGCIDRIPWEVARERDLPRVSVFALELGGLPLSRFPFPREGLLIIGSEELGVSPRFLTLSDNSLGRVSLLTGGEKGSINVSVAFGIVQHFWYSKITGE